MVFQDYMETKFSKDEQATELYQLLLQIGNYTELTMSEEVKAFIDLRTDPTRMLEEGIRRYLASFYVPVRNVRPASGTLKVTVLKASAPVSFSSGDRLVASNGSQYELTSSGIAGQGQVLSLTIRQAASASVTGNFKDYITFEAKNIDLDSIELVIAGVSIPRVEKPTNGYIPFIFDGVVYIPVYKGSLIPKLEGQPYSVTYRVSDGASGNVDANAFQTFVFEKKDANLKAIQYALANDAITNGADSPSLGELRDLLVYWHHTKNYLSRPCDYRNWFLLQPEVGDCLAWGDSEEIDMGIRTMNDLTGIINICLISPLTAVLPEATRTVLFNAIKPFKDAACLKYVDPGFCTHAFDIRYTGTDDDASFLADALGYITSLYTIASVRTASKSVFEALDVGEIVGHLAHHASNPRGLEIVPYFYLSANVAQGGAVSFSFPSPKNLKRGYTRYIFDTLNASDVVTATDTYTELMTSSVVANIVDAQGAVKGTHNYQTNTITFSGVTFPKGRMKVYGEALNRSYLDTGAFKNARLLGPVNFVKVIPEY